MEKSKTLHIRVDNDIHKKIIELAGKDSRTVSGFIVLVLRKFLKAWK